MMNDEPKKPVERWLTRIDDALKKEKDWRKSAEDILEIYEMKKEQEFNILFSNVETMRPSLFFKDPEPYVSRRYSDRDPVAREASTVLERAISYSLDDYDFYAEASDAVLDLLLPGRAVMRIEYAPEVSEDVKVGERVYCKYWPWDRFCHGEGRRWHNVKWICYEHHLSKKEFKAKFPKFEFKPDVKKKDDDDAIEQKVYEIWDKLSKKVIFLAPAEKEEFLAVLDDPLGLEDFFNTPRPLYSSVSTSNLIPIPDYLAYKKQAEELAMISARIQKITKGLKLRGIYDSTMKEMETLMMANDNELIPATNAAVAATGGGGLDRAIWFWPVETAAKVLAQLYLQRDQIKQVIYEITGLSDILRGASDPNETLGAQELKAQTGSLRIQRRQREIQRYFRDIFRIKGEIIAEHFEPDTLSQMTGKPVSDEIMQILSNDKLRGFAIDIETDSTISPNIAKEQESISNALQGISLFASSFGPLVQAGMFPAEGAKEILMSSLRKFQFGRQVEEALESPQQEGQADPQQIEQQIQQGVQQKVQEYQQSVEGQKMQAEQQKIQVDQQKTMTAAQQAQQEMQMAAQKLQLEEQRMMAEHELKMKELQMKNMEMDAKHTQMMLATEMKEKEMRTTNED